MFPIRRFGSFVVRMMLLFVLCLTMLFLVLGSTKETSTEERSSPTKTFVQFKAERVINDLQPRSLVERKQTIPIVERILPSSTEAFVANASTFDSNKIAGKSLGLFVHLDLKGAPPKISFFEKLFPLLKELGAQGICVEYEDMFPFEGLLEKIKHKQSYSKTDIDKINQLAKQNQLDVMPLLQTYGHLEFLLKIEQFADLRENSRYPQVISPCINKTYSVLFTMIDQYLSMHPDIKYFHIGNDEVFYFFSNPACQEFRRVTQLQNQYELFAYHLRIIIEYIKKKRPTLNLFIWHDILQNLDANMVRKYNLMDTVIPVLWSYREEMNVEGFVVGPPSTMFGQFQSLWGATAFKGATDEIATISDVRHYYLNQVSWIQQLRSYIPSRWHNFQGMMITGWSRYDHFLSLCELLPYSIPSLAFSLSAWRDPFLSEDKIDLHSNNKLQKHVQDKLGCSSPLHLTIQDHSSKPIPKCQFPGASVYESLIALPTLLSEVDQAESFVDKFVTDLHMKYNYIHTKRAEESIEKLNPVVGKMKNFIDTFQRAMEQVFPSHVAVEWLETYFMKRYRSVAQRLAFIQKAMNEQKFWPARPIPDSDKLQLD